MEEQSTLLGPEGRNPQGWGLEGWGPKGGAPKGGAPKVGPRRVGPEEWGPKPRKIGPRRVGPKRVGGAPKGGEPKISRFFFPFPPPFWSFCVSLGVLLVEFWWCLKRRGPEKCTFGVLGLSCASSGGPVWWGRRGFTRQPESPNVHILGSRPSKTPPKFHEKTPRETHKDQNGGGRVKKKSEILGGPAEGVQLRGRVRRKVVQGKSKPTTTTTKQHNNTTENNTTTTKQHNKQHNKTTQQTTQQNKTTQHNTTTTTTTTTNNNNNNNNNNTENLAKTLKH